MYPVVSSPTVSAVTTPCTSLTRPDPWTEALWHSCPRGWPTPRLRCPTSRSLHHPRFHPSASPDRDQVILRLVADRLARGHFNSPMYFLEPLWKKCGSIIAKPIKIYITENHKKSVQREWKNKCWQRIREAVYGVPPSPRLRISPPNFFLKKGLKIVYFAQKYWQIDKKG